VSRGQRVLLLFSGILLFWGLFDAHMNSLWGPYGRVFPEDTFENRLLFTIWSSGIRWLPFVGLSICLISAFIVLRWLLPPLRPRSRTSVADAQGHLRTWLVCLGVPFVLGGVLALGALAFPTLSHSIGIAAWLVLTFVMGNAGVIDASLRLYTARWPMDSRGLTTLAVAFVITLVVQLLSGLLAGWVLWRSHHAQRRPTSA
jgi:hypothetical protein